MCPLQFESQEVDLDELQGPAETICKAKCRAAASVVGGPVLVEDTSLCFSALGDLPGPYIKWFLKNIGPEGLHKMLLVSLELCIFDFLSLSLKNCPIASFR